MFHRRNRLRRVGSWCARWGLSALTVALACAWAISFFSTFFVELTPKTSVVSGRGLLWVKHVYVPNPYGLSGDWLFPTSSRPRLAWENDGVRTNAKRFSNLAWNVHWLSAPYGWEAGVPIWMCLLGSGLTSWWLWRRSARRRRERGRCLSCGYDVSTLPPGSACPECGDAHPTDVTRTSAA